MGILDGKVAVITGSSRGLGWAIAVAYAREGALVVLSGRDQAALDMRVQTLTSGGFKASGFACDVQHLEQVQALGRHARDTFGRIDIWVNNAGLPGVAGPTALVPVERYERTTRTNILGTYYGSITALDYFLPQRSGKLINLLGRGDDGRPVPFDNAYAPSKIWVRSFTLGLAKENKDSGVGIFAYSPGLVDTELLRKVEVVAGYEGQIKALGTVIQFWANPPDVPAQRAVWLASAATDGKTGLKVDILNRVKIVTGILRFLVRKALRRPMIDPSFSVSTVAPESRQL